MESPQNPEVAFFFFLAIGMTVLALLAGGVIFFFLVYQKRLLQQKLAFSELEAAHTEALLHSNIEQVEEERKRIAKDLHDEVGSIFSTLKLKINQLNGSADDQQQAALLADSLKVIDTGMSSVRRISHGITPPGLEMFGLADAAESLCESLDGPTLEVVCEADPEFPRLPARIELGLYRIIQELLNNAMKHAAASKITVTLAGSPDSESLQLVYVDNGKGFDPAILKMRKGLGLNNIEARATTLHATVTWITQPGDGLQTIITIPSWKGTVIASSASE